MKSQSRFPADARKDLKLHKKNLKMEKRNNFSSTVYQVVAQIAGYPRAYRAVGNIMHNNPDPKTIPCHRVVASGLKLGGYAWGTKAKIKKLQAEGWKIQHGQLLR